MTERYNHDDWLRLGKAVQTARIRHGYADMTEWASIVGRSTRTLLGLERGEEIGKGTLRRIEASLEWEPGHADELLAETPDDAPSIGRGLGRFIPEAGPPGSPTSKLAHFSDRELLRELLGRVEGVGRRGVPLQQIAAEEEDGPAPPSPRSRE